MDKAVFAVLILLLFVRYTGLGLELARAADLRVGRLGELGAEGAGLVRAAERSCLSWIGAPGSSRGPAGLYDRGPPLPYLPFHSFRCG